MDERREHPRSAIVAKVEAAAEGRTFLAAAENISPGGMLIFTANPVGEGVEVVVTFVLPGAEHKVRTPATVRHVNPHTSMGVQFTALAPSDRGAIEKYMEGA